jgi:hypothetical protein
LIMPRQPRIEYPGANYHVMSREGVKGSTHRFILLS